MNLVSIARAAVDADQVGKVLDPIIRVIVNPLIQLMFALAVVIFIYGVIQMIINGEDADARAKGRDIMLYGVIGMFIMVSAWGIIRIVANTVGQFAQ